jgi:hypothetical protein
MNYNDGLGWLLMNLIGPLLLAAALAYGGYETYRRRRARGLPVGPRAIDPGRAAALDDRPSRSAGTYLVRLGLPVLAALILIAIVAKLYF